MNLLDGHIIYPKLTVAEFMTETATWSIGLHGVICDDAGSAHDDLAVNLINYNALLSRDLSVYDYDSDEMIYYRTERERFLFHFDRIHRIQWRYRAVLHGLSAYPAINSQDALNASYLKIKHLADSSYAVLFLTLPSYINGVDKICSQIVIDYTYSSGKHGAERSIKNYDMKRTSNVYYVYDQEENFFYRLS